MISLERFALNVDDCAEPDNAGRLMNGRPIVPNGPAAYRSTLPLMRMHTAIRSAGVPNHISNHAGTYVCNHVFYVARYHLEAMGIAAPCGFMHVPPIARGPKGISLAKMIAAVDCCLKVLRKTQRAG